MKTILILGMSGAGKTVYSGSLGFPVLHYDTIHDYRTGISYYERAREWKRANTLSDVLVVDFWRLDLDPYLAKFLEVLGISKQSVEVHLLYTSPWVQYLARLDKELHGGIVLAEGERTLRDYARVWGKNCDDYVDDPVALLLLGGFDVQWVFRKQDGTYDTHYGSSHLHAVNASDPVQDLLEWIKGTSGDPTYQTIELDGETICNGYTRSEESWKVMQQLEIDWRGKTVCDFGCFNGYFSFKVEEAGAKSVDGFDQDLPVLKIAPTLASLKRSKCRFHPMNLSDEFPDVDCDVALVMNSLHHIAPEVESTVFDSFVKSVFLCSRQSVFEVERDAEDKIKEIARGFPVTLAHNLDSHRVTAKGTRRWLHFKRVEA